MEPTATAGRLRGTLARFAGAAAAFPQVTRGAAYRNRTDDNLTTSGQAEHVEERQGAPGLVREGVCAVWTVADGGELRSSIHVRRSWLEAYIEEKSGGRGRA